MYGRLLTGVTWAVLLLGLWLWGSELTTDVRHGRSAPPSVTWPRSGACPGPPNCRPPYGR